MDYNKCLEFTKEKHSGQTRKQGTPYYIHPVSVSMILKRKGFPEEYQIAGLFHDLIEDTDATELEILQLSNYQILETVKLLTKYKGYDIKTYIDKIRNNEMARSVKLADKLHNLIDIQNLNDDEKKSYQRFKIKTLKETERWYVDLAKGTVFEKDINKAIEILKKQVKQFSDYGRE